MISTISPNRACAVSALASLTTWIVTAHAVLSGAVCIVAIASGLISIFNFLRNKPTKKDSNK